MTNILKCSFESVEASVPHPVKLSWASGNLNYGIMRFNVTELKKNQFLAEPLMEKKIDLLMSWICDPQRPSQFSTGKYRLLNERIVRHSRSVQLSAAVTRTQMEWSIFNFFKQLILCFRLWLIENKHGSAALQKEAIRKILFGNGDDLFRMESAEEPVGVGGGGGAGSANVHPGGRSKKLSFHGPVIKVGEEHLKRIVDNLVLKIGNAKLLLLSFYDGVEDKTRRGFSVKYRELSGGEGIPAQDLEYLVDLELRPVCLSLELNARTKLDLFYEAYNGKTPSEIREIWRRLTTTDIPSNYLNYLIRRNNRSYLDKFYRVYGVRTSSGFEGMWSKMKGGAGRLTDRELRYLVAKAKFDRPIDLVVQLEGLMEQVEWSKGDLKLNPEENKAVKALLDQVGRRDIKKFSSLWHEITGQALPLSWACYLRVSK